MASINLKIHLKKSSFKHNNTFKISLDDHEGNSVILTSMKTYLNSSFIPKNITDASPIRRDLTPA